MWGGRSRKKMTEGISKWLHSGILKCGLLMLKLKTTKKNQV